MHCYLSASKMCELGTLSWIE